MRKVVFIVFVMTFSAFLLVSCNNNSKENKYSIINEFNTFSVKKELTEDEAVAIYKEAAQTMIDLNQYSYESKTYKLEEKRFILDYITQVSMTTKNSKDCIVYDRTEYSDGEKSYTYTYNGGTWYYSDTEGATFSEYDGYSYNFPTLYSLIKINKFTDLTISDKNCYILADGNYILEYKTSIYEEDYNLKRYIINADSKEVLFFSLGKYKNEVLEEYTDTTFSKDVDLSLPNWAK